jgi:NAD(P)H-flavin reductase
MQSMDSPTQQSATLIRKTQLSPHVFEFVFELPTPITYIPGQYATFIIDAQTRRQYSFALPSTGTNEFTIVVDVTPMGPGSKFFLERTVGDVVSVLAPLGTFRFEQPTTPVVFVATGTGIMPFRSMIETYLTAGGTGDITFFWGLRHEEDIFWKDMLDQWQITYPNFHYSLVLSKPSSAWQGKTGHVTEHIVKDIPQLETHTFYLCGNRHMISDVKTDLLAHKVPEGQIKTELF